ncbi:hypothetical protein OSTOST_16148, partial [Ostertagia ostertagi]
MEAVEFRKFNKVGSNKEVLLAVHRVVPFRKGDAQSFYAQDFSFAQILAHGGTTLLQEELRKRCKCWSVVMRIGKTTEAITRKMANLPTIPADLSYDQFCRQYLDNESYIPLMYQKAGYKEQNLKERKMNKKNRDDKKRAFVHIIWTGRDQGDNMVTHRID